jgi:ABC-type antimicrobial peptide transport system permease subunit
MAGTLGRLFFEIRTVGEPTAMIPAVREAVRRIDRDLPLVDVKTQSEQIQQSLSQERMFARLASFFAALALLLVAVGLYGTLSYAVTRRTNEIGIRMALGAQRFAVLWMVLRESLVLILAGAVIGLPLAFATTRFVESQLYGVQPNDVLTVSAAVLVLAAAGALASYLPARRAARVDPMVALRYE